LAERTRRNRNKETAEPQIFTAKQLSRGKKKDMKAIRHAPDYVLLFTLIALVCFGILMVYSSSYYTNAIKFGTSERLYSKQILSACVGFSAVIVVMQFDYHTLSKWRNVILVGSWLLLWAVFIPGLGMSENGSSRWINVGISVQPSEIMKFSLIVFISSEIGQDPGRIKSLRYGYLRYMGLLLLVCIPIFLMPNMSAIICICLLVVCLVVVGGAKWQHIAATVLIGVAGLAILIVLEPYRVGRMLAFLDPFNTTVEATYQLRQSLYSIASGGLFGRGLGNSMQKLMYLPFSESDFIFAIIVEEMGLFGALLVLAGFGLLIYRGVRIALTAPDLTGCLMATGVTAIIAIQVLVNIAVCTGCVPPTGVVLPFISYGGSAVAIFMGMVGLLLCISRYTVKTVRVEVEIQE